MVVAVPLKRSHHVRKRTPVLKCHYAIRHLSAEFDSDRAMLFFAPARRPFDGCTFIITYAQVENVSVQTWPFLRNVPNCSASYFQFQMKEEVGSCPTSFSLKWLCRCLPPWHFAAQISGHLIAPPPLLRPQLASLRSSWKETTTKPNKPQVKNYLVT